MSLLNSSSLRIGISVSFSHPDSERALFRGKTLHYVEEEMALSIARSGAIPTPLIDLKSDEGAYLVLEGLDGVIFSGGADVSPLAYGEEPLHEDWHGDAIRDSYEFRLIQAARTLGLPMLGICRGAQVMNVALGGTLYQDINTQQPETLQHRCGEQYDQIAHPVHLVPSSWLGTLYPAPEILVNTVHHQAVKNLAPNLNPTATAPDGITEAYERINAEEWMVGIQWHPEWLNGTWEDGRVEGSVVFEAFYQVCAARRTQRSLPIDTRDAERRDTSRLHGMI
jgi:putative glutamine amidotransferase